MRIGDEYILDPIHIKGEGPKGRGIFADTSYADLPTTADSGPTMKPGHWFMLAALVGGLYLVAKS